jgi:hypothetical protein
VRAARVDPDGTVTWQRDDWQRNLLLNAGMDFLGANRFARIMFYGTAATGSRVNKFDSGGSQVSQSGYLLGLSGSGTITNWSVAGDSGRYTHILENGDTIQLSDGTQIFVSSALITALNASASVSNTFAPQTFTIWKTSQAFMEGPRVLSSGVTAGLNGSVFNKNSLTLYKTFDFAAESINKVYREVGMSNQGQTLMNRILLDTPITIPIGSQLRLQFAMAVSLYPSASVYYPNDMITNWPGSGGTASMQSFRMEYFDANGNIPDNRNFPAEAYNGQLGGFISSNTGSVGEILLTGGTPVDRTGPYYVRGTTTNASYTNGTYFLDRTCSFSTSQGSSSLIRSFGWGNQENYGNPGGSSYIQWAYLMNNSQSKSDLQTLVFGWRTSWTRSLFA